MLNSTCRVVLNCDGCHHVTKWTGPTPYCQAPEERVARYDLLNLLLVAFKFNIYYVLSKCVFSSSKSKMETVIQWNLMKRGKTCTFPGYVIILSLSSTKWYTDWHFKRCQELQFLVCSKRNYNICKTLTPTWLQYNCSLQIYET